MRNIVRAADLEHRHPNTSRRGRAAIIGHHHAHAPPSQNFSDEDAHSRRDADAIHQKDAGLNDTQEMAHLLPDQQVLLNERPPTRVGRKAGQHRFSGVSKT